VPVLLDTHVWVWSIDDELRLTRAAVQAIEAADGVFVSPITLFEICQKVRIGKWPEMAVHVHRLQDLLDAQSIILAPLSADIAIEAGLLDWPHRDPFDRMLAATAVMMGMDLISADTNFDTYPEVRRVW
jgi:PIN domain nuclease of toxin-antitoxin system